MTGIVWEDPPPAYIRSGKPQTGRWHRFAKELEAHPGQWAKIENSTTVVMATLKKYGCEARSAGHRDGRCDVYARWPEVAS